MWGTDFMTVFLKLSLKFDYAARVCLLRPPPMTHRWLPLVLVDLPPRLHLDRYDQYVE